MTVDDVIDRMKVRAARQYDGSGLFYGSPRGLMEVPGVSTSNGRLYHQLRARGVHQHGRRQNAVWIIPRDLM